MAAVGFYRVPTKVHATAGRSFEPVMASVEYGRDTFKVGETVTLPVWGINDYHRDLGQGEIRWRVGGASGAIPHHFTADSSRRAGELTWTPASPGHYTLSAEVWIDGKRVSANLVEFMVKGDASPAAH